MMQKRRLAWLMTAAALGTLAAVTLSGVRAEPVTTARTGKPGAPAIEGKAAPRGAGSQWP